MNKCAQAMPFAAAVNVTLLTGGCSQARTSAGAHATHDKLTIKK